MPDTITLTDYYYTMVPDKPGEGVRVLNALRDAGVNLLAYSGFPEARRTQIDFVPENAAAFVAAAKAAKINLTATDAVCAGMGRYGAILWVKPRDVKKAAKVLGVA